MTRFGVLYVDDEQKEPSTDAAVEQLARSYAAAYEPDAILAAVEQAGRVSWDATGAEHVIDLVQWYFARLAEYALQEVRTIRAVLPDAIPSPRRPWPAVRISDLDELTALVLDGVPCPTDVGYCRDVDGGSGWFRRYQVTQ